jgi:ATP-dependent RNA helicase UAP56/SUB2
MLDHLTFNQVVVFVNKVERAIMLTELLKKRSFNPICIHRKLEQEQRILNYDRFKSGESRLLVATDVFGRGMDIERVDFVVNFGMPP